MKTLKFQFGLIAKNPYSNLVFAIPPEFHEHAFFEFAVVLRGKCKSTLNGKESVLQRGSALFLRPEDVHCIDILTPDYKHQDVYVMPEKMARLTEGLQEGLFDRLNKELLPAEFALSSDALNALEEKFNVFNGRHGERSDELDRLHSALVCELIGAWLTKRDFSSPNYPDWLNELLANLHNLNYLNMSVKEIAETTNYSHGYVCKMFRKHLGTTLLSYINRIKVDYSADLLAQNKLSVLQIASMLGWDNPKNYAIEFKKVYGISPGPYRRENAVRY